MIKVCESISDLRKIFGKRFVEYIDGSCVLQCDMGWFYVYGVLDCKLIMKEIPSRNDLRFRDNDFCIIPIESVAKESWEGIEYAKKLESKFMSKFGYSFDFIRYNRFCEIILGESHYFLPADSMLTIEDFIRYLPDLAFKKGLRIKYIDLYCMSADFEERKADFCILNTQTRKYVSTTLTFSELNSLRLVDLLVRYKELYPVGSSKYVKVIDVSKDGIVKYEVTFYKKVRVESMPLDLFLDSTSGMLLGLKSPNDSGVSESFCDAFTKDIENAIREYQDNVRCNWGY